jgi:putative peptidoglycan lipid II flippase
VALSVGSNILGFAREMLIAHSFGTSAVYDIYVVAQQLPSTVYFALFYGMPAIFIPLFNEIKQTSDESTQQKSFEAFFSFWAIVFIVLAFVCIVFAEDFVRLFFKIGQKDAVTQTSVILRWLSSIIFVGGIGSILRAYLNDKKVFIVPAFSMLINNVAIIGFIYFSAGFLSIFSLILGTIAGILLQTMIIAYAAKKHMSSFSLSFNFAHPIVRRSIFISVPILAIEILYGFSYLIDVTFAAQLPSGNVAALNYSMTLFRIPAIMFGLTIGSVILPHASEAISKSDMVRVRELVSQAIRLSAVVLIPMSTVLFMFSTEIVSLAFQRGLFTAENVITTSHILRYTTPVLYASVLYYILLKVLNALWGNRALLASLGVSLCVKIVLCMALVERMQMDGIILAFDCSILLLVSTLVIIYKRKLIHIDGTKILRVLLLMSGICLVTIVVAFFVSKYVALAILIAFLMLVNYEEKSYLLQKLRVPSLFMHNGGR